MYMHEARVSEALRPVCGGWRGLRRAVSSRRRASQMLAADAPLLSATSLPLNYCSKALNRSRAEVLVSLSIHRRTYGSVGGAVVAAACACAPVSFRSLVVALYSTPLHPHVRRTQLLVTRRFSTTRASRSRLAPRRISSQPASHARAPNCTALLRTDATAR
jgi:hypothetical protein